MRRRLFWAMVTVAAVTLVVGGFTATILVGRSVAEDRRDEFFRQAEATAQVIEAPGQVLLPGLVDLHTHLREPGREYAEDIETGSAAAALGGLAARIELVTRIKLSIRTNLSRGVSLRKASASRKICSSSSGRPLP